MEHLCWCNIQNAYRSFLITHRTLFVIFIVWLLVSFWRIGHHQANYKET